jgi:hypothetical protein
MTVASAQFDDEQGALIVSGVWQVDAASALPKLTGKSVRILDGAGVTQLDTNGAWLLLALPLLVFIGDIAGMAGGMLVPPQQRDISYYMFMDRVADVLDLKTLLVGLGKAPVFAIFIALIACRMGLSVTRDARSVGANTTSTVVQSLVAIIILNAIFAISFVKLGI